MPQQPIVTDNLFTTAVSVFETVIDFMLLVATPLLIIMVLFAAFQMLFSAGDKERFQRGVKTLMYGAIGYALVLLADNIPALVRDIISTS